MKFFQGKTAERDISIRCKSRKGPKKIREKILECIQISQISYIQGNIFSKILNSLDCVGVLFN